MILARRSFLAGLGSLLAAPAIVHAGNIMPVRSIERLILPAYDWDSFDAFNVNMDATYQWVDQTFAGEYAGWSPVPASRYSDRFSISGQQIKYGGLVLMQKRRVLVVEARAKEIQAAHDQVANWGKDFAYKRITRGGAPVDLRKDWEA